MNRRLFLGGLVALSCQGRLWKTHASSLSRQSEKYNKKIGFDENLIIFISDTHIQPEGYTIEWFDKIAKEILAMRPLPRNIINLGDLAHLYGKEEDYRVAKELFAPLEEAGIRVTHAMGNHDRRDYFTKVFPEKAALTSCPNRIVSIVETPHADVIVLDSLQQSEDENKWITPGNIDEAQREWLKQTLQQYSKPVFIVAHHPLNEVKLGNIIFKSPTCCGYIHGHDHRWRPGWDQKDWKTHEVLRTLCLPSTGYWGDIGYACMKLEERQATVMLEQRDYFFPKPLQDGEEKPLQWKLIEKDNKGLQCRFSYIRSK
ncbi:MAG: metallophosphoesterase [Parabacteroides sp.]|nr:metallophosphoesterase [Parabacteroides sp.]